MNWWESVEWPLADLTLGAGNEDDAITGEPIVVISPRVVGPIRGTKSLLPKTTIACRESRRAWT